jgi:hypothetical protein
LQVEKVTILEGTDEMGSKRMVAEAAKSMIHADEICYIFTAWMSLLMTEFKEGQSPVEGKTKYISCFATDDMLQGLIRVHHGDERLKAFLGDRARGGRGCGRGVGR